LNGAGLLRTETLSSDTVAIMWVFEVELIRLCVLSICGYLRGCLGEDFVLKAGSRQSLYVRVADGSSADDVFVWVTDEFDGCPNKNDAS
jgi:hypothetical protein